MEGLSWGSLLGGLLIGGSGWWLTRRALQPTEQYLRQLKQFTADASHELRSPLTVVRTTVEVMQNHPERFHEVDVAKLRSIHSATVQMSQLVDDLLFLARSDHKLPSALAALPIPLDELLEDLTESMQPQAAAKQIQLSLAPLPPMQIKGDARHLR